MRILHLAHAPQRRGAELFARRLARIQRSVGHETRTVFLYPAAEPAAALALEVSTERLAGGREDHPLERLLGVDPGLLGRLAREVADFRPDVVQTNGGRSLKYGACLRRTHPRAPWAVVYKSIGAPTAWLRGAPRRFAYRHVVGRSLDGIVAVSAETLADVERVYRPRVPTAIIENGVDLEALRPTQDRGAVRAALRTPPDAPVVLSVGSLSPEKRLDRLLRIVARVRADVPGVVAWIVGAGRCEADLRRAARALGLGDAVRWAGPRDDVGSLLAAADVFALTSDTEGLPGAVLEASALSRPVVATRVGGVPTCVHEGVTGHLVAPDDEAGFALRVTELLVDEARRRALGAAGRALVEERFSIDRAAREYDTFYARVLAARGAR